MERYTLEELEGARLFGDIITFLAADKYLTVFIKDLDQELSGTSVPKMIAGIGDDEETSWGNFVHHYYLKED